MGFSLDLDVYEENTGEGYSMFQMTMGQKVCTRRIQIVCQLLNFVSILI